MLEHEGQAVEPAFRQHVPREAGLDQPGLPAAEGEDDGPRQVVVAGRQRGIEGAKAKPEERPDDRDGDQALGSRGKSDAGQPRQLGAESAAEQHDWLGAQDAHQRHHHHDGQQQHGGILSHRRQAEQAGAEPPRLPPAVVQVPPVGGGHSEKEKGHAHVRGRETAVREHGGTQRTEGRRDHGAGRAPEPVRPEEDEQERGRTEEGIHHPRPEEQPVGIVAALVEEIVADEPHNGLAPRGGGPRRVLGVRQRRRKGLPALGQDAVFRLQPEIVPVVERIAPGHVRDFVRGGGLFAHRPDRQSSVA